MDTVMMCIGKLYTAISRIDGVGQYNENIFLQSQNGLKKEILKFYFDFKILIN